MLIVVLIFQFQCGAIESLVHLLVSGSPQVFQFQCGAIERRGSRWNVLPARLFQFQCGAIERVTTGLISLVPI